MKNYEVAKLLYDIADLLEFQGIDFKPAAYRKAASNIESLSEDIESIFNKDKLEDIPGVGKHIAEKISEYIKTGKIEYLSKLKRQVPVDLDGLMKVPELGPKKIKLFYEKLKIKSVSDLKKAALSGKLSKLPGMGEKSQESILKGIEIIESLKNKMLLSRALHVSRSIESELKSLNEVQSVIVAGSVRRMKDSVGDIDVLVISNKPTKVMNYFVKLNDVKEIIAKGETKSSVILVDNTQVDLRILKKENYGSALNYFTGSKEHNVAMRKLAISKGMKLSEYGLFKGLKLVAGKNEQEIYRRLGLKYIEPELRENTGEIDAAKTNSLPNLVGYGDIKGDLQMHTTYSDGKDTISEMAKYAKNLDYQYIAVTDHSKLPIAGGMTDQKILSYIKEIRKINVDGIKIYAGCETNVDKKGNIDVKNNILKELDIVLISIHSNFKMSKNEMTNRILKAMDNEHVKVFAHPTARMIGKREPIEFDIDKVFEKAKTNNIWLEINAHPERLDLRDFLIKKAKSMGNKFVISTDSHSTNELNYMELGIGQARRGWLESKDVINSLELKKFDKLLNR